jgi:apolipoprotein N-acyltransferase
MSRRAASARAVAAGVCLAASVPPWGWWPLAFVGFALLDRLLEGARPAQRWWRTAGVAAAWLYPATFWMVDLTLPGYLVAGAFSAALYGLGGLLVPPGAGRRLALPAAVTVVELVRWSLPFGGVPLATVPMGQVSGPLGPTVRLAGALLLTALVVAGGVLLSALARREMGVAGALAGLLVASVAAAAVAPGAEDVDEARVAVVQGGGPQRTRFNPCNAVQVFQRQLDATALIQEPVDVVLWPENVVNTEPEGTRRPGCPDLLHPSEASETLAALARTLDAVVLPGWFREDEDDPAANLNYTESVEPDGTVSDRYDKVRTVPFGEFVPLRSVVERFSDDLPRRDVRPGEGPAVVRTSEGTFGVAISWEIFFDHRTRDAVRDGAEVLLNPTNGASYWLTIVQSQQVAASRLRALETDRWVLQAAPTGFSAVIDPDGEVLGRIGVGEQGVLIADVGLREGRTLATRVGVWPMLLWSLAALAAAWTLAAREGRMRPRPAVPADAVPRPARVTPPPAR